MCEPPGELRHTFGKKITVHGAMHDDIQSLCDYLVAEEVTLVVMEATGDYWESQELHQMGEPNASLRQLAGRTTTSSRSCSGAVGVSRPSVGPV